MLTDSNHMVMKATEKTQNKICNLVFEQFLWKTETGKNSMKLC